MWRWILRLLGIKRKKYTPVITNVGLGGLDRRVRAARGQRDE